MTGEPLDERERRELCALMLELGPSAPTLCTGWTVADLAAHLIVRERDPRAMPGIVRPRFAALTARLQEGRKAKGFVENVELLRQGAPLVPWRVPGLRSALNLPEYVVHHEDVRRANGLGRRYDRADLDAALWSLIERSRRLLSARVKPIGLEVRRINGDRIVVREGPEAVVLTGHPSELLLYLFGRRGSAEVAVDAAPETLDAFLHLSLAV